LIELCRVLDFIDIYSLFIPLFAILLFWDRKQQAFKAFARSACTFEINTREMERDGER